jgi:hypothetical protein
MRAGIVVNVTRADRRRLEAIVADRCAPQKHVWRAQIILATADGCGTAEIIRRSGKAKPSPDSKQAARTGGSRASRPMSSGCPRSLEKNRHGPSRDRSLRRSAIRSLGCVPPCVPGSARAVARSRRRQDPSQESRSAALRVFLTRSGGYRRPRNERRSKRIPNTSWPSRSSVMKFFASVAKSAPWPWLRHRAYRARSGSAGPDRRPDGRRHHHDRRGPAAIGCGFERCTNIGSAPQMECAEIAVFQWRLGKIRAAAGGRFTRGSHGPARPRGRLILPKRWFAAIELAGCVRPLELSQRPASERVCYTSFPVDSSRSCHDSSPNFVFHST